MSGRNPEQQAMLGPQSRTVRRRGSALQAAEERFGLLLALPAVLVVVGVYIYPALLTLSFSFAQVDLVWLAVDRYVGLHNYLTAFSDPRFLAALGRTIYFSVVVVSVAVTFSFLVALLLNQNFFGRGILRLGVLLPWAVPPVVAGVIWGQMFHAEIGLFNAVLYQAGFIDDYIIWLGDPTLALHTIMSAEIWRMIPFVSLFLLAGLQTIPGSLYEAAAIDGSNVLQRLRHITLPLMAPILVPVTLISFIWSLKSFDIIFTLTRGGPRSGTTVLNYLVYRESFEFLELGYGSALAYILLVFSLLAVVVFWGVGKLVARRLA